MSSFRKEAFLSLLSHAEHQGTGAYIVELPKVLRDLSFCMLRLDMEKLRPRVGAET